MIEVGKYARLGWHLANEKGDEVERSFEDIEGILGFLLPKSAKMYRPWWANDSTHVQASDGWIEHGWNVDLVDMEGQVIRFRRTGKSRKPKESESANMSSPISAKQFEDLARTAMSEYYGITLYPGETSNVKKLFDMVSEDGKVAGDAKYLTMVRGKSLPPAKFSVIAEHVWLLGKTGAKKRFLVFGNDRRVPEEWLRRYGNLVTDVDFFFYDLDSDLLEELEVRKL